MPQYPPGFTPDPEGFTPDPPPSSKGWGYLDPKKEDVLSIAAKAPVQLGEFLVGLGDIAVTPLRMSLGALGLPNRSISGALKEDLGYDPKMLKDYISSYGSPEAQAAHKELGQAQGIGEFASTVARNPGLAVETGLESLPYIASGAGIAQGVRSIAPKVAPWAAGAIGEGITGAGTQAAQTVEDTGDLSPIQALIAATSGGLTGLTSGAGSRIAHRFGFPDIDTMLADPSMAGARRILARIGGAGIEAGEEVLQSGQEQAASNIAAGRPIGQGVPQAGLMGGVAGGIIGGALSGGNAPPPSSPVVPPSYPPEGLRQLDLLTGVPPDTMGTQQQLPFPPRYREAGDREVSWANEPYLPYTEGPQQQGLGIESIGGAPRPLAVPPSDLGIGPIGGAPHPFTMEELINQALQEGAAPPPTPAPPPIAPPAAPPSAPPPAAAAPVVPPVPPVSQRPNFDAAGNKLQHIPREKVDQPLYQDLVNKGWKLINANDGGFMVFVKKLVAEDEGTFDPQQMWQNLKQLLGRDPTPEEVQQGMDRQVQPGEETGRIAPFPRPPIPPYPTQNELDISRAGRDAEDQADIQNGIDPNAYPTGPIPPEDVFGPPHQGGPYGSEENPSGLDIGRIRQQNVLGPQPFDIHEAARSEMSEAIPGVDQPIPLPEGQMELPWSRAPLRQQDLFGEEPQEMRVPGVHEGRGGLENVALGGADPRVWDVVGSSLYARKRPVTTVKELLQNAWDEHKEIGVKEPVRVIIDKAAPSPFGGTDEGRSITVRDRGRGLSPENIYTYLTNLGSTGKAGVVSAAGGFGFAKAAPFTGGKFTRVRSVIDMPDGTRMMYTFEGRPSDLKNQRKGVPLHEEEVGPEIPTGLEVYTFYDADIPGFYDTAEWAKNMAERSPSVETPTKIVETYHADPTEARAWLDETPQNPITGYNYMARHQSRDYSPEPIPTLMDTIDTPGADINIHYDIPPGTEASEAQLHLTNKGMYQGTQTFNYGEMAPNVPRSIVADIVAKVEEGHEAYPFSANREQLNDDVAGAIKKWVSENIITGVTQKRVAAIQKMYDDIAPIHPMSKATKMDYLDEGNLLTPDELNKIVNHPKMVRGLQTLERIHTNMLLIADTLGWTPVGYNATWNLPSERLKKFGLLFKAPDSKGTVMGIHIPRPDDVDNSAILFNLMEHLNAAANHSTPIDKLVAETIVTLAHEQAHIPGGPHDKGHSYRDADLRTAFGAQNTVDWFVELNEVFGDGKQGISPEILELLQIYNESRERASGGINALLATGIASQRQPNTGGGTSGNIAGTSTGQNQPGTLSTWGRVKDYTGIGQGRLNTGTPKKSKDEYSIGREALALPAALMTTVDLSPAGRTGLLLVNTPQYWTSLVKAMGAIHYGTWKKVDGNIRQRPNWEVKIDPKTQKPIPSLAQRSGLTLYSPASEPGPRAENVASRWIETGSFLGPLAPVWKHTVGYPIRASGRFYTTFLNLLQATRFDYLMDRAKDMSYEALTTGKASRTDLLGSLGVKKEYNTKEALNLDPYYNDMLAREIGSFVGAAIGQGKAQNSLEKGIQAIGPALFAPGLLISRVRMLNPGTYLMASPYVRKQYLKAALGAVMGWYVFNQMAKIAADAMGQDSEINYDPTNADFGKFRIGDTRLDFGGGFLQLAVLTGRAWEGGWTSSSNPEAGFHKFGEGFQPETQLSNLVRFASNKLNPVYKFAWDVFDAAENKPLYMGDRLAQSFVPLFVQDVIELAGKDPELLPWVVPILFGAGTQTYGKFSDFEEGETRFTNPEADWKIEGGGLRDLIGYPREEEF